MPVEIVAGGEIVLRHQRRAGDGGADPLVAREHDRHHRILPATALSMHRSMLAERRLVAVAADDVHQLGRVGEQALPAVGLGHLARVALVEAHARGDDAAGILDAPASAPCGRRRT